MPDFRTCRMHVLAILFLLAFLPIQPSSAAAWRKVLITTGGQAGEVEGNIARLLESRLREIPSLEVQLISETQATEAKADALEILLGIPSHHAHLKAIMEEINLPPLTLDDPGEEGFHLKSLSPSRLLAMAADERGMLYAVGEILRRMEPSSNGKSFPEDLDQRTAPAFRIRGMEVSQGTTITELTGSRSWTQDELNRVVLNYALAGANTFGAGTPGYNAGVSYDFVRSYGLKTIFCMTPNLGSGPDEWLALEAIGRKGYLCPAVPEARESILKAAETRFSALPFYDYVRFNSGDGGGCECDRCAPYGKAYIELCKDLADILHKYHPKTLVMATQQKLDNVGDQAIFDFLNSHRGDWLYALSYGPGSNAMGWFPGRRQDHRMDLFRYPAFGPIDRYLREMLHQLPPEQTLVCFTDLTHWVYSQYGLMNWYIYPDSKGDTPPRWGFEAYQKHPDPSLAQVYDRRTFHARPRNYYHVFQNTMRYTEGDITYSEGHHDHFNQWMWQRLLWNPNQSVDEAVHEYARVHFGKGAEEETAKAIFQLEENLSSPLATNSGIDRIIELLKEAARNMPEPWRLEAGYLWRQYMQKALLDKYIQLRILAQQTKLDNINRLSMKVLESADAGVLIRQISEELSAPVELAEMRKLREEAGRLGEESNRLFGVRSEGYFNLDVDLIGFGWIEKQIRKAQIASTEEQKRILLSIGDYENPGKGGFYDDAGNPDKSPRLVHGWQYEDEGFSPSNRRSQNTAAYTQDASPGVTFRYVDLDPQVEYKLRLTLARPRFLPRYADRQPQKTESIYVDDHCIARDLELPEYEAEVFEFPVPKSVTEDGKMVLRFEKSAGTANVSRPERTVWRNTGGWGTLVSEVWLTPVK